MQSREHAITRYQCIRVRAARRSHPVALTGGSKADCPCPFAASYYYFYNNRIAIMLAFISLREAPIRRRWVTDRGGSDGCCFAAKTARRGRGRPFAKGQSGMHPASP